MHRRRYLSVVASTAGITVTALAGCAGTPGATTGDDRDPEPRVRSNEPTVAAGETVTVTALAEHVTRLSFGGIDSTRLTPTGFDVEPPADTTRESLPPAWTWDQPTSGVRAEMRVRVAPDAPDGEYPYAVRAADDDASVRRTFVLCVRR